MKLYLEKHGWPAEPVDPAERARFVADVTASFEAAVVDVLDKKIWKAVELTGISKVIVAGGVAANPHLRQVLGRGAGLAGAELFIPPPSLCGDNAAMIGMAALNRLGRGERSGYNVAAIPNLDDWSGFYTTHK